jgi:hypothetical protein
MAGAAARDMAEQRQEGDVLHQAPLHKDGIRE